MRDHPAQTNSSRVQVRKLGSEFMSCNPQNQLAQQEMTEGTDEDEGCNEDGVDDDHEDEDDGENGYVDHTGANAKIQ